MAKIEILISCGKSGTPSFTDSDGDKFELTNLKIHSGDDQGDRVEFTLSMNGIATNTLEWIANSEEVNRVDSHLGTNHKYGDEASKWIHDELDYFLRTQATSKAIQNRLMSQLAG